MRRSVWCLVVLMAAACSADSLKGRAKDTCPTNAHSRELVVTPEVLVRGSDAHLRVRWTLESVAPSALATVSLDGAERVELTLPLTYDGAVYDGEATNPFGTGVSPGVLEVLVTTQAEGCDTQATASTSINLE